MVYPLLRPLFATISFLHRKYERVRGFDCLHLAHCFNGGIGPIMGK